MGDHIVGISAFTSPEGMIEDASKHLGRANGNVWVRKSGVEGVHDGQIMIRLKKKRFICIDYGTVPTALDLQNASLTPHTSIADGAGKTKCLTSECEKIGIPVVLYDSEPTETPSLYARTGLCFTCQRVLNEKRRTQRKRKSDGKVESKAEIELKRFKIDGKVLELSSDAIIINGAVGGARAHSEGYPTEQISRDLQESMTVGVNTTASLLSLSRSSAASANGTGELFQQPDSMFAPPLPVPSDTIPGICDNSAQEDIAKLYDKAFMSLSKSIYLLSQWKVSWDTSKTMELGKSQQDPGSMMSLLALTSGAKGGSTKDQNEDNPLLPSQEASPEQIQATAEEIISV